MKPSVAALLALFAFLPSSHASPSQEGITLDELLSPQELQEELRDFPSEALRPVEAPEAIEVESDRNEAASEETHSEKDLAPVVIVINKAAKGRTAQTMFVYKDGKPVFRFRVSTGREKWEVAKSGRRYYSATPRPGFYRPTRLFPSYYSHTWKAQLQWMMLFNVGVGIHATSPDHYAEIGTRASGGCVRLREPDARALYALVVEAGSGRVPLIRNRKFVRDGAGKLLMGKGPNTLIVMKDARD